MTYVSPFEQLEAMLLSVVERSPYILLGTVVFIAFFYGSRTVTRLVIEVVRRTRRSENLALVLGRIAQIATVLIGLLVALTIILPSFKPAQLIELFGITSVAIGFAFRDILQNFLAGIIILLTEPFSTGDQIAVGTHEGTIEEIETRATFLRTYDGRRIVIPNSVLFTEAVLVNTAFETRRWEFRIGIGYRQDLESVKEIILAVVRDTEGVLETPRPEVIVSEFADLTIKVTIWYWTYSRRPDGLLVQDKVLTHIHQALNESGIRLAQPALAPMPLTAA